MNQDLKRFSSVGNIQGILFFAKHVLSSDRTQYITLKSDCYVNTEIELNFPCALATFEYLGLISATNKYITSLNKVIYKEDDYLLIKDLGKCTLDCLIQNNHINVDKIIYDEASQIFKIPKSAFSLDSSVFRNMLISLGLIFYENDYYVIKYTFVPYFSKKVKEAHKRISLEQLKRKLEKEQIQGEAGEVFVEEYERSQFLSEDKRNGVMRISDVDVSAGYDIVSYLTEDSPRYDKFIEVKTYIGRPHFFWSANEIDIAKVKRNRYFLYVIDFNKINNAGYVPIIIQNPFDNLIGNPAWKQSVESCLFELIENGPENVL